MNECINVLNLNDGNPTLITKTSFLFFFFYFKKNHTYSKLEFKILFYFSDEAIKERPQCCEFYRQ